MFLSLYFDVYFLGSDYINKDWEMKDVIQGMNKEIIYLSRNHEYSSTKIKNKNI